MLVQDKSKCSRHVHVGITDDQAFIITGGCGSIGGTTAKHILERGGSVVVSSSLSLS
jgi:FlaA1/EpsC-like NDP-sugar epimerase